MTDIEEEIKKLEEAYDCCRTDNIKHDTIKYDIQSTQRMIEIRPRIVEVVGQGYFETIDEGEYEVGGYDYTVKYEVPSTDYIVELNVSLYKGGFHVEGIVYKNETILACTKQFLKIEVPNCCEIDSFSWYYPISKLMDDIVSHLDSVTKTDELRSILEDSCKKFNLFSNEMIENKLKNQEESEKRKQIIDIIVKDNG